MMLFGIPADAEGVFLERPNRFLARVEVEGRVEEVHLHDPGRLPDLTRRGCPVLLRKAPNSRRKTRWDLLAFRVRDYWCFCHSGYHRRITANLLFEARPFGDFTDLKAEPRVGEGRLDFLLETSEGSLYLEVKGVTWAQGEVALFPDAPTERGVRHLRALISLVRSGNMAGLLFLVFRQEARRLRAAEEVDPAFAGTLREALRNGLQARAAVLSYDGQNVFFERYIPIEA